MVIIKFKKLNSTALIPSQAYEWDAGYDLAYCGETPLTINPGETVKVPTGLIVEIPYLYFAGIFARSGLSTKRGLAPINCVGVVDSGYRGELTVPLHNHGDAPQVIFPDERIAQMIVLPNYDVRFQEVEYLSDSQRGVGGFGSSHEV